MFFIFFFIFFRLKSRISITTKPTNMKICMYTFFFFILCIYLFFRPCPTRYPPGPPPEKAWKNLSCDPRHRRGVTRSSPAPKCMGMTHIVLTYLYKLCINVHVDNGLCPLKTGSTRLCVPVCVNDTVFSKPADGMQLMARHRLIMLVVFVLVVLYVVRLVNMCLKVVLL